MIEYLLLGVGWLLLSLPVSVLIGKCISVGQAGETARHAGAPALPATSEPALGTATTSSDASSLSALPELPAQRERVMGARAMS